MSVVHNKNCIAFKLLAGGYYKHFFVNHCSPSVNQFLASSIKDKILNRLDTNPLTYLSEGENMDVFHGDLEEQS